MYACRKLLEKTQMKSLVRKTEAITKNKNQKSFILGWPSNVSLQLYYIKSGIKTPSENKQFHIIMIGQNWFWPRSNNFFHNFKGCLTKQVHMRKPFAQQFFVFAFAEKCSYIYNFLSIWDRQSLYRKKATQKFKMLVLE